MKNITNYTIFFALILASSAVLFMAQQGRVLSVQHIESATRSDISAPKTGHTITNTAHTEQQEIAIQIPPAKAADLRPVHIIIPAARVHAEVINVGVTPTNNLDVPPNFVQAGWYKYGTLPGNIGNAVIDGHVDNGASIDGIFKHLRDVRAGDIVTITMSDGTTVRYVITYTEVVKTTEFPGDTVFHGSDDKSVLKIITCHGTFVKSMDTYDQRLIVTAELIPEFTQ